ncbi:MAG: peptidoglycan DD-metalloendopeptidase family protein [Coriobacteriia bacterium]|nr:peptidoglycan DD-metalloendopeptidase family protein [Coriobacteriia bacterium]
MTRFRAYLAATLCMALLLAAVTPAYAVSAADAAKHASTAASARAKAAQEQVLANQLKTEAAKLDDKVQSLQSQANALDPQITTAATRAQTLRQQVDSMRSQISSKTAQISATQAEVAREQGLLAERVTAAYKGGEWWTYIDMLLGAHDFRDLIARTELVDRVLRANSAAAEQLSASKTVLSQQKAALDQALADVDAKRHEADAVEQNLKGLQSARQEKVAAQQGVLNAKSQLLAETQHNAKRLLAIADAEQAESARIRAELSRSSHGSGSYHGGMSWPVPGFQQITSPFGWRMHPILHKRIFHAGIDISGPGINGAPIIAAGAGTVIAAGPHGGYGNVVMIDHGNGVVTVYGHQQSGGIRVSVGQHVKRGQRIGTVGSTGMSTGPHLHFEVRVNGSAVNPLNYL